MSNLTPPRGYAKIDTELRKEWIRKRTGISLDNGEPDDPESLKGIIENHVGFVQIPMAVAGPLKIDGSFVTGDYYIPLCTLEGTLTMSMTRGLLLTYLSGGIKTRHLKQELSRSPIFIFSDIDELIFFENWIQDKFETIKVAAESTTRHGQLLRVDSYPTQNSVILDFVYHTSEAAGQNMVTIATHKACEFIRNNYPSKERFKYYIECNFNCDKNPAYKTVLRGRGHKVVASALIPEKHLKRILRTTPQEFVSGWSRCSRGALMAGVLGVNMHVANALTAIYLATGQDAACVAENAVGNMEFEVKGESLYTTLTMPSISVGTIGGGTRLSQQRRNLELLGCVGPNSSKKLAEIVCAAALALELSLGGAILTDEFASAHADFGRR
jgi:hydroxymethylglutaryl-CoA reductase (NADPH)